MTAVAGIALVVVLLLFGAILAVAEAAMSRMSRVRAITLREEGHRNAALLEEIENQPPRYLNPIYLCVMLAQNGSAILVAILAEQYLGELGLTLASIGFTLLYYPTRLLIGIANVLLPGKGLKQGPFVSEQDIRSMAEVGHEEGSIAEVERKMIHSIFEFGDTTVGQIMVPRPDIVAVEVTMTLHEALDVILEQDASRAPVYRGELDRIEGILHVKDALKALHGDEKHVSLKQLLRPANFVPESKKASDLMREMRRQKFHMAVVCDEYGSVSGLITLEDLLEQLVGKIADEHDVEEEREMGARRRL
jgi:CBS domain containing-hemolysin-like protein